MDEMEWTDVTGKVVGGRGRERSLDTRRVEEKKTKKQNPQKRPCHNYRYRSRAEKARPIGNGPMNRIYTCRRSVGVIVLRAVVYRCREFES